MKQELLRVGEAAKVLNVSRWTIYRWVEEDRLKATKIGKGSLRIFRDSIEALVEHNRKIRKLPFLLFSSSIPLLHVVPQSSSCSLFSFSLDTRILHSGKTPISPCIVFLQASTDTFLKSLQKRLRKMTNSLDKD